MRPTFFTNSLQGFIRSTSYPSTSSIRNKACFLEIASFKMNSRRISLSTWNRSSVFTASLNTLWIQNRRNFSTLEDIHKNKKKQNLTVAVLGPPNAGKSTLFNRLMCKEANKTYRLASEKKLHKKKRSRGRIGHQNPSDREGGAIVSSTPGTTRDRRECIGRIGGTYFTLVDTAGVDSERIDLLTSGRSKKDPVEVDMMLQTLEAAKNADLIFLMFDAKVGITTDLEETCRWLRKVGGHAWHQDDQDNANAPEGLDPLKKRVVILGNKLEGDAWANYYDIDSTVMDHLAEIERQGFGEVVPISAEHGEGFADIAAIIEDMTDLKLQTPQL